MFALSLFNPLDPTASYNSSTGLLLPAYTSVLMLQTGSYASSIAMGQYGYQTYALVEEDIAYTRTVAGPSYDVCTNGAVSLISEGETNTDAWWLPNFSSYETETSTETPNQPNHTWYQVNYYWVNSWTEPYWTLDTVNHSINGAQLAQSFLRFDRHMDHANWFLPSHCGVSDRCLCHAVLHHRRPA